MGFILLLFFYLFDFFVVGNNCNACISRSGFVHNCCFVFDVPSEWEIGGRYIELLEFFSLSSIIFNDLQKRIYL